MSRTFTEIVISSGQKCEIIEIKGVHVSKAFQHHMQQHELDLSIFLMSECVLINGEKEDVGFFEQMYFDDYNKILEGINCQVGDIFK